MKITIITLNYNGAKSTIRLLESLKNQTDSDFSLVVTDNASAADDLKILKDFINQEFPTAVLIENKLNTGFSGGSNTGMRKAIEMGSDWLILLNNDTWVEKDFVSKLRNTLIGTERLVGLPIDEGGGEISLGGRLQWLKPTLSHNHGYLGGEKINQKTSRNIHYAIGGGMAIGASSIKKIGYFDENYFLYFEDADLSLRARRYGISIHFPVEPIVHHTVSTTTKLLGSPLLLRYHYRNALYFNFKNAPILYKVLTVFWSGIIVVKQFLKIGTGHHVSESKAILAGVLDFYQNRMGIISRKIKVGIECEQIEDEIWGVGKIVSKLLENIASRPELSNNFEFHLYFKSRIPKLPFLDNPIFHKKIIPQPFPHKSFVLYYYLFLPIELWFDRLEVMFFPNYMLPILFVGKSVVMLTEDIYYEMRSKQQKFQHRLAYGVFATWASWWATRIMAISETSKKELIRLFNIRPERIIVNHLGIDMVKSSELKVASSIAIPASYLLFVGQAFPRRHLVESLLAFEKIASDFPDLKFVVVGPDKYSPKKIDQLRQEINSRLGNERVIWHERVSQDELEKLYGQALATVYISSREAFGLPPLEGLAQGSVPIVADNALSHELFGEAAIFVSKTDSVSAITEAFREAITNTSLREKTKERALGIISRYTWRAHTDRFLEIIKSMAHDR